LVLRIPIEAARLLHRFFPSFHARAWLKAQSNIGFSAAAKTLLLLAMRATCRPNR
jgi:hypothetical protein